MAVTQYSGGVSAFRRIFLAIGGTETTATVQIRGTGTLEQMSTREEETVHDKTLAAVSQSFRVEQGCRIVINGTADFETLPYLFAGIKGNGGSPTAQTSVPAGYLYNFAPDSTETNEPKLFTIWLGDDHQEYRAQNCFLENLEITAAQGATIKYTATFMGHYATLQTGQANTIRYPANSTVLNSVDGAVSGKIGTAAAVTLTGAVLGWTIRMPTGLTKAGFYGGGLDYNHAVEGKRRYEVEFTFTQDTTTRSFLNQLSTDNEVALTISNSVAPRSFNFVMNGIPSDDAISLFGAESEGRNIFTQRFGSFPISAATNRGQEITTLSVRTGQNRNILA